MSEASSKFVNIRNLGVKTVLVIVGLLLVVSALYPFILENFYLTDKVEEWDGTEWIMIGVGFFLAVGGAKYNTAMDIILGKFKNDNNT